MKAISSAAVIFIAIISISLAGSYFLSRIMERPVGVEELGIFDMSRELQEASCTVTDGGCYKAAEMTCALETDCYIPGSCVTGCENRDNAVVVDDNCTASYSSGCTCKSNLKCSGRIATCTVSGFCNYTCVSDWYNDDDDTTNGCENAPPRYSNPIGSGPSNPSPEETVYHWVNWIDVEGASLDTAILEVNSSGTNCDQIENVSFYGLSGTSDIANISWQVGSNCGGKVIAWKQYANDTANRWNVSELQTYTVLVPPIDLSFNLTLPGIDPIESSEIEPGTASTPLEFNATAKTDYDVVPCVYGYGCNPGYKQDDTTPIFGFTNTGNTAEKWNISLSQALPSYAHLYGNTVNSRVGATEITTSGWVAAGNIPVGDSVQLWLWADFIDALPGRLDIAINHTSMTTT